MSENDAIEAGELALGVLDGDERAAALRRVIAEPAFAAKVARWRGELSILLDAFPAVDPPAAVEARVLAAIGSSGGGRVASGWRPAAIVASLMAAALAAVVVWPARTPPPAAPPAKPRILVAALQLEGGKPFNAVYDARAGRVAVLGTVPLPRDRGAELWLIAPGGSPRPVGMLGRGNRSSVALRGGLRSAISSGATLAISVEPVGGSPTGAPTGPVVASGALVEG